MDQYDEYNDPDPLKGIFSEAESERDSEYEDALTEQMHQQAEQQAIADNNNPHYKPFPISLRWSKYKEGEIILSDYNREKIRLNKIKKIKELIVKLLFIIKNLIFNFICILVLGMFNDLGQRLFLFSSLCHFDWNPHHFVQIIFDLIFNSTIMTIQLQFWFYFNLILISDYFCYFCIFFIKKTVLWISNWLTRIKIKDR